MTTMRMDTTTTTTATRSPLSDSPLPHPTNPLGLGGGHVGRGDKAGPVPGVAGMTMKILVSGLESVENSKYSLISWT